MNRYALLGVLTLAVCNAVVAADPSVYAADRSLAITTQSSFKALMSAADARMMTGMQAARRTGHPDHDFATMMIPHHQGAIDMARVELLYGTDPVLQRLAQEIIITQQQEIAVMRLQIKKMKAADPR